MADKASRALGCMEMGWPLSSRPPPFLFFPLLLWFLDPPLIPSSSPPSENVDARIIRELAELLDSFEAYNIENVKESLEAESLVPSISQRCMGMKAALITNSSNLKCFGNKLVLAILQLNEIIESSHSPAESWSVASQLLKLLGFEGGKTLETSHYDLLFIHKGAGEGPNGRMVVEHVNDLVGSLLHIAKPGNDINYRLHLSVIMSYEAFAEVGNLNLSIYIAKHKCNSKLSLLFPHQSYTMKGGKPQENVRQVVQAIFQ